MDELNRLVAGLRCREVLDDLSAYVDGELEVGRVKQIEDHLRGCDRCERFGGRFAHTVGALRAELGQAEALSPDVEARLRSRLQEV